VEHVRAHRATLRFAVWDLLKGAGGGAGGGEAGGWDVRRLTNLGRLAGRLIAAGSLPLAALKVVDFGGAMPSRLVLLLRVLAKEWLGASRDDGAVRQACQKAAAAAAEERGWAKALSGFLGASVGPWLVSKEAELPPPELDALLGRLELAQRCLR
jgi:hypothetical protein